MDEVMYGPMQLLVIVFDNPNFHGQIRRELESVMNKGMIRLIDLLFIWKDEAGNIKSLEATQLDEEERMHFGAVVGGLIGYGAGGEEGAIGGTEAGILAAAQENYGITEEDILEITEAIPEGTAAAILIIEHLWAKSLKQAIRDAGGVLVSQGMLTPELLVAVGEELTEAVKFAEKKKKGPQAAVAF
ncbi:DUF1269 domain-containing protein [Methanosarcina sp. DH1]|uniref:DUF1269 domain-containing protein n=1 Tax=Methanosarcina sp. DH1 TaxID=2605695 RepID=UPI001E5F0D9E|nr:DUF1269 domain-containing protein [Methanosarcina sp. DH1]MCC4766276.1 DUF1269 domain-containing protein [Methanosarcina sp. DH1]